MKSQICQCSIIIQNCDDLSGVPCPSGWLQPSNPAKNECYKFALAASLGDYDDAKAYCPTQGGYLTDILDQETQDLLLSNIPSVSGVNWMAGANDIATVSCHNCRLFH